MTSYKLQVSTYILTHTWFSHQIKFVYTWGDVTWASKGQHKEPIHIFLCCSTLPAFFAIALHVQWSALYSLTWHKDCYQCTFITLTPTLQRPSSHSVPMITLVTMVSIVHASTWVSNHGNTNIMSSGHVTKGGSNMHFNHVEFTKVNVSPLLSAMLPMHSVFYDAHLRSQYCPFFSFHWIVFQGFVIKFM